MIAVRVSAGAIVPASRLHTFLVSVIRCTTASSPLTHQCLSSRQWDRLRISWEEFSQLVTSVQLVATVPLGLSSRNLALPVSTNQTYVLSLSLSALTVTLDGTVQVRPQLPDLIFCLT
jgi:hypothetical protein